MPGPPTTAGTYTVEASFAGSQDYLGVARSVGFFITQDRPVLSLSAPGGTYDGNPVPATATIAGVVPGLDNTPGSSLEGIPVTLTYYAGTDTSNPPLPGPPTNAGVYLVAAAFAGSLDYLSTQGLTAFQISAATPTIVASDTGGNFTGNPYPATATATGVGGGTVTGTFTFTYYVGSTVSGGGSTTAPSAPGTYTVVAAFTSGDSNYATGPTNSLPVTFAINPLPALNAPSSVSLNENGSFTFTTPNVISVTDAAGSGNNNETVSLTVSDGTLSLTSTAGVTVTGSGSASASVSGPLASVNTVLASLVYTPGNGFTGSDTLVLNVLDTTDNAQGAQQQISINVNPLAPTIAGPPSVTVSENGSLVFTGGNAIRVTDLGGNAEQLTLTVNHGSLSLGTTTGLMVSGSGTATLVLTGPLTSLNADLPSLSYTPTSGYTGPDTLGLSDKDTADNLTGTGSVPITVQASLGLNFPATATVAENSSLVFYNAGGNSISITDPGAGSNIEELTLTATHGTIKLGGTTGLTFVSGSNSSGSMTVKGTLANLNADLSGLVFTPTAGYMGAASLSVTFEDLTSMQSVSGTVAISVTAPASSVSVAIKTLLPVTLPYLPVPFVIIASDTNSAAQAAKFTININYGDGNSQSLLSTSPLLLAHAFTRPGTYTVSVTATDEFGHTSAPATVVIRVVFVFIGINPFNPKGTALYVGGTGGSDTVNFTAAANGGIGVTLNGVSQGVFTTTGPLIVFNNGVLDTVTKGPGISAPLYVAQSPNDYSIESDLESEAQASFYQGFLNAMNTISY